MQAVGRLMYDQHMNTGMETSKALFPSKQCTCTSIQLNKSVPWHVLKTASFKRAVFTGHGMKHHYLTKHNLNSYQHIHGKFARTI